MGAQQHQLSPSYQAEGERKVKRLASRLKQTPDIPASVSSADQRLDILRESRKLTANGCAAVISCRSVIGRQKFKNVTVYLSIYFGKKLNVVLIKFVRSYSLVSN